MLHFIEVNNEHLSVGRMIHGRFTKNLQVSKSCIYGIHAVAHFWGLKMREGPDYNVDCSTLRETELSDKVFE